MTRPLREFEGPLDLLLEEVRRQNVAIEDIAMAPIVARFLEYIRTAADRNLNLDIEWLHLAAILIHWKSRSLLPSDRPEPTTDPIRDELVQRLLVHRKEAAEELAQRRALEDARFSRVPDTVPQEADSVPSGPDFITVWDLLQQARELARWTGKYREDRRRRETFLVERDDVTVSEMIEYLQTRLSAEGTGLDGISLLSGQSSASRKCCLFLAMLEMSRDQKLEVEQNEAFGAIHLSFVAI